MRKNRQPEVSIFDKTEIRSQKDQNLLTIKNI